MKISHFYIVNIDQITIYEGGELFLFPGNRLFYLLYFAQSAFFRTIILLIYILLNFFLANNILVQYVLE